MVYTLRFSIVIIERRRVKFVVFYWYAHGARYYDPQLALWHSSDPLSEMYSGFSPYHYAGNNPVNFVDPNGMSYGPSQDERDKINEGGHYGGFGLSSGTRRLDFWSAVPTFEDQYVWMEGTEGGAYVRRTDIQTYYGADARAYYLTTLGQSDRYNVEYYGTDKYGSTDVLIEDLVGGTAKVHKMAFWKITGHNYNPLYVLDGYLGFGQYDEAKEFASSITDQLVLPVGLLALGTAEQVTFSEEFKTWMGKDGKIRSQNWGGNGRTGGKFKFARKLSRAFNIGGAVADVYGVVDTYADYSNNEITRQEFIIEQTSNAIGFVPLYGTVWSFGWTMGKYYGPSTWFGRR